MSKKSYPALLGADTEYEGKLCFKGEVRINGKFTGEIVSEGRLVIGKNAVVTGSVQVGELVVIGSLQGDVIVSRSTLLHQEAEVQGTLNTPRLAMEDGAILQGILTMREPAIQSVGKKGLEQSGVNLTSPINEETVLKQ